MSSGHYRDNNRGRKGMSSGEKDRNYQRRMMELVNQAYKLILDSGLEGIPVGVLKMKLRGRNRYYEAIPLLKYYYEKYVTLDEEKQIWYRKTPFEKQDTPDQKRKKERKKETTPNL